MNCVQCGEELPASAKFCKKCGCKVGAVVPAPAAGLRGMPPAPTPAYTTCPDCGALCKGNAVFCNKCGCRFEEKPDFDDTKRDMDAPLTVEEERAILVFGNVQDSSEPASQHNGERIETSPAMVIGSASAVLSASAVPAPSLRPVEPPATAPDADWLVTGKKAGAPAAKPAAAPQQPAPAPAVKKTKRVANDVNPMPVAPVSGGNGLWIGLGVVALVALVGGGAWWWNTQGKNPNATPAPAPAAVATPAPQPAPVAPDAALAPNESIAPSTVVAPAPDVVEAPAVVAPAPAPAAAPEARPAPAPRKPARKQTLDDLLN